MSIEQLEDRTRKQLKTNAERTRKRLKLPTLNLPVNNADEDRVEWFVNQLRGALAGARRATERYEKAMHFPHNPAPATIKAVAQNLSVAQNEKCAYELHAHEAATWLSACGAAIGQTSPLLDEFVAGGLIQSQQAMSDAARVLAAAKKNKLRPAPQPTGVSGGNDSRVGERRFTYKELRTMTGYSSNAGLYPHFEIAEVKRPKQGGRKHKFTDAEVRKVLRAVIDNGSDFNRAEATKSLNNLNSQTEIKSK